MERATYKDLLSWKSRYGHHPLLLTGAPLVGKTYLAKDFGKREYSSVARFSFLDQPITKAIFKDQPEVTKILKLLSSLFRRDIIPGETLLILDDIQHCPDAVEILADFAEDAPTLDVIACGTFAPGDGAYERIPASSIDRLALQPLTYKEFLLACGQKYLVELLEKKEWDSIRSLDSKYKEYLKEYSFCGGMPSMVDAYVNNKEEGPFSIRQRQKDLLQSIEGRLSKKQLLVWNAVAARMTEDNHKFMFADLKKGARQKDFMPAVEELQTMGLIYSTTKVSNVSMPMDFYQDKASLHLFPLDPGLLGAKLDVDPQDILLGEDAMTCYSGAFPRMAAMVQLRSKRLPVYYYAKQGSLVDIDFLVQTTSRIYAIEVNAIPDGNTKALKAFAAKHPGRKCLRASLEPHFTTSWMENVPLYALEDFIQD